MQKKVHYCSVKFSSEVIKNGFEILRNFLQTKDQKEIFFDLTVKIGNETWDHDNDSEFFSDYCRDPSYAYYRKSFKIGEFRLAVSFSDTCTDVTVTASKRRQIEDVHQVFAENSEKCTLPEDKRKSQKDPIIFLGHGGSAQWRELKDHLQDKHCYRIEAYEVGARAGHTIRDILDEMLTKSSFALLVMTGEDKNEDGKMHARENVIHELGLFQGKLGFPRAIVLLEDETNEFSNIHGIQQIRFSKGNIREAFGDVLATLKREFDIQKGITCCYT